MNQLLNIGYSGMRAAQHQLNVSALNMANMATPGYTRQRVEQQAIAPMGQLRPNSGNGVEVTGIRRMADPFLTNQVWSGNTKHNFYQKSQSYLGQLESILGSENSSLGDGLEKFFGSLNGATEKPDNQAMRQDVLTNAKQLAMRFNNIQQFLNKQRADIRREQQNTVTGINSLSSQIADYNKKITETEAQGGDTSILRDQRDERVKELSGYIDVRVNENADGSYALVLKSGEPLVSGSTAGKLAMTPDKNGKMSLSLAFANTDFKVDMRCGGALGGLYQHETGTLDEIETSVMGMAKSLAEAFNAQLRAGYDLNGDPGQDLFTFDPTNPDGMLQVTDLTWEKLAFSSDPAAVGNNDNLKQLIELNKASMNIPGMGSTSLSQATASLVSTIGIKSRENQSAAESASTLLTQAEKERDDYSGVSMDEEAMNLIDFTKAYQANMKTIATGDQIFNDLLQLF